MPQGLQLRDIFLVVLDILWKLFISIIYYPFGIFIGCKASVSSPCLASISKGSMRFKRLDTVWLWFVILVGQILASWITTLMNSPNSQVILKYSHVYLNSQPSTVTTNHEGSRSLVSMSTTIITGQIFL